LALQVRRERFDRLAIDATDHILAPPLDRDKTGEAQLLQVMRDRRVDLLRSGDVAADFSYRWPDHRTHRARLFDSDRAAARAEKLEYVQAGRIPQRLEHRDAFALADAVSDHLDYSSFRETLN